MVETYYKKITRFVEYYIFLCFIIITIFPLLEYSWVPGFIKFIYFTGFPLLVILLIVTLTKDAFVDVLKRRYETPSRTSSSPTEKR